MTKAQLNALISVAYQLPAIAEELRKANELKALELKIRIQNDWHSSANAVGEIDDIMAG